MQTHSKAFDLFKGHPSTRLLASDQVLQGCIQALGPDRDSSGDNDSEDRHPLTYGSDPGSVVVRQLLADWSCRAHHELAFGPYDPACFNLTNGASYGAREALLQCTRPQTGQTRRLFVVDPTYFLIMDVFGECGFDEAQITAVPDTDGIDVSFLERELRQDAAQTDSFASSGRKIYTYVLYLVPTFSNPTGSTIDLQTRLKLLALARQYDMLIISDDCYDLLYYCSPETIPPRLVALDLQTLGSDYGHVVSNCTFSKYLGPGLRSGWNQTASPRLAQQLCGGGAVKSGGTPAHFTSKVVAELIRAGTLDQVLDNLRCVYGERCQIIRQALARHMPEDTVVSGGQGGYFVWVTLPSRYNVRATVAAAKKKGLILAPENQFRVKPVVERSFRLSFSYEEAKDLEAAVALWSQTLVENA